MDDTFSIVAPVMPRRQHDPFAVKLAAFGAVLVLLISAFGAFVVIQERAADARRTALEARIRAQDAARAQELAAQAEAALVANAPAVPAGVARVMDREARTNADAAVTSAQGILAATGSLGSAGVATLSQDQPSLVFVDGPSTAPTIVSVATTGTSWAAAAMGPSGTCYWATVLPTGDVRYGRGGVCTGRAALAADRLSW